MVNTNKLKGKMVEKEFNVEKLAKSIDIDRGSMYRKLNNPDSFTVGEVERIAVSLELTSEEAMGIFFNV